MTARARSVFALEFGYTLKRPLFWFLVALLALFSWGLSTGNVTISSGDASVGGTKAWLTSEFSVAFMLAMLVSLLYSFYGSIAAGTAVLADDDQKVGELLHSTPLSPGEYVWGKFLAILAGFAIAFAFHLAFIAFFNHVVPNARAAELRGPFLLVNYLRPALVFALPTIVFFLGVAFFLGERWRRPLAVFLFPVAVLLLCGFFLWNWAPTWLDPRINRILMLVDPGGFRWLNETWLKLDRGARFYNTARIGLDLPFVLSRLAFAAIGVAGVALAQRHLAASLRGEARPVSRRRWALRRRRPAAAAVAQEAAAPEALSRLGMSTTAPGFVRGAVLVAGTEVRNLLASPALYIFVVLILLQTLGNSLLTLGAFQTEMLLTAGLLAVQTLPTLSFLLCLLLMFYTVESLERDRATGFAAIAWASPTRTGSILFGKALANSLVGVLVVAATFVGCAVALLIQHQAGLHLTPFLLVWGLLLVPTFLVWTSFILAVQAVLGQRFATYGIGLAALAATGYFLFTNRMNWLGNWPLWQAARWSDMGFFELDRRALLLNRLLALGLTALFTAVAVRGFGRRQADAMGTLHRLAPGALGRQALRLAPYVAVPAVVAVLLGLAVLSGFQGGTMRKKERDYWKQNLATWKDATQPAIADVDLDLRLDPPRRFFHTRGRYQLVNDREEPIGRFALTGGFHWRKVRWTLDGKPWQPEDRTSLYVFTPPKPLAPGSRLTVGFEYEGVLPPGISKNGGTVSEFILPSGVVLTSFTPTFAPVVGYLEEIGRKKGENDYETKVYPDDFYKGITHVLFGVDHPFSTRIAVTGPAEYTYNSVGTRVSETVAGGLRTAVWQSDHPVRLFNVVAGRWRERPGKGTRIFYHPGHPYNIAEMSATLDAARRYYSEWFYPYPWRELKLSEFPNLATYAQGFPTDITFSEGIGFLTKSDVKTNAVFLVTAHESAHQWWGNLLTPGKGPGANILSEGMSHFSTMLLMQQVKGEQARMEFCKRIEEQYGERRRVDAERPLVKIDDSHDGDTTVTYDKGGWVFWMMQQQLGRERMLAGLRKFMADYANGPDYPVLQDFTATLRPFAPDAAAYDAFVEQWFHQVVVPEYQLRDARRTALPGGAWQATVKVKNAGGSRMPVAVAATRGDRFTKDGKPGPAYRDARQTVVLGAGEEREVAIACLFQPEKVVVDPDVQVLQLRRKVAVAKL
jgi:ABC-2 type transport system permease protein